MAVRRVPTWFPGANFKRDAEAWHKAAEKQLHVAYDDFLKRLVGASSAHSILSFLTHKSILHDRMQEKSMSAWLGRSWMSSAPMRKPIVTPG